VRLSSGGRLLQHGFTPLQLLLHKTTASHLGAMLTDPGDEVLNGGGLWTGGAAAEEERRPDRERQQAGDRDQPAVGVACRILLAPSHHLLVAGRGGWGGGCGAHTASLT